MSSLVPAITGFDAVPQACVQYIVVPSVPTTCWEQQVTYSTNAYMWGVACVAPWAFPHATYDEKLGSDPTHIGTSSHQAYKSKATTEKGWQDNATSISQNHESSANRSADVSVVLSNLPKVLSSEQNLAVALEQAHVEDFVRLFSVEQKGDCGEAVVILSGERAAQRVIKHFQNMKGGNPSQNTSAWYCSEAGKQLMLRKGIQQAQLERESKEDSAIPYARFSEGLEMKARQGKIEHANRVAPLPLTKCSMKVSWADYDDDDRDCVSDMSRIAPSNVTKRWADFEDDCDWDFDDDTQSTTDVTSSCSLKSI